MKVRVRLEEVTEFIRDGTHGSPERVETGIPVLSAMNVKDGVLNFDTDRYTSPKEYQSFAKRLPLAVGDVLLTIVGTIGRSAVITEVRPLVFQRSVAVIRPKAAVLSGSYFFHVTQSVDFRNQLDRAANKSSQAGVYLGKLGKIEIPLPSRIEQDRISNLLDKVRHLQDRHERAIAELDDLYESLQHRMFFEEQ